MSQQLVWIFAWIGAGFALSRVVPTKRFIPQLNRLIIWICLPATILLSLHQLTWDSALWIPISMAWIVFSLSVAVFVVAGRVRGWSRQTVGALVLTAGLGNTSFLGYPLLRAIYGEHAISIAVLNDQPGTFLVLSTLGIYCATFFSDRPSSFGTLFKRIFRFPPIWATILGFVLRPLPFPQSIDAGLGFGIKAMIPLALISVGAQITYKRSQFERELAPLFLGISYKLLIAPALMLALLVGILHLSGETIRVTLLEAAMGPMITGAIVAIEFDLDPSLCSLMVSIGIPLGLITVPLFAKLLAVMGI